MRTVGDYVAFCMVALIVGAFYLSLLAVAGELVLDGLEWVAGAWPRRRAEK